uniref:Xylulose kinase n=1 Tax=Aceria tosichella TaxID=561515 RepID=A0A6G1SJS0_9ACAR
MSDDSSNRTDVSTIHLDNISLQNRDNVDTNSKFLGFDLSTQQLKAIVIDDKLRVCHQVCVDFDTELSEYKTRGGVYKSDDGSNTVTAPVNMWLKAMDMCFDKLKVDGLDFSTVLGISGCAQQHGSVWWRRESSLALANLNPDEYLHKELVSTFTLRDTPIWMDSSTSEECRQLEAYVGGPARLAELTGSRAYERFTGPQIAKVIKQRREVYLVTERITLISNFIASILIGSYAPLDASDASGMNMMDIRKKRWSDECLEAIVGGNKSEVAGLRARLGCLDGTHLNNNIVDTHEVVGRVSRYFIERYGFPPECLVSSFTGDNPGSMAGLCVRHDELVISLGTSDTAFFWLDEPRPNLNGHVLRNPLDDSKYMGLICFKNGSKTRERIRDVCASGDWDEFGRQLNSVPRGNFGNIGFYYDLREIYPLCKGDFRYNKDGQRVESFANNIEVRACLEGQFMRLYHHSRELGLNMANIRRILVTGGASQNQAILQVIADLFKSPVYTLESMANSASLGGAYLAKYAYELEQQMLDQSFANFPAAPSAAAVEAKTEEDGRDPFATSTAEGHDQRQADDGSVTVSTSAAAAIAAADRELIRQEKQISFSQMILGHGGSVEDDGPNEDGNGNDNDADEECREINLIKMAEPTPISSQVDVYESLLERYVRLETEIGLNNGEDPSVRSTN